MNNPDYRRAFFQKTLHGKGPWLASSAHEETESQFSLHRLRAARDFVNSVGNTKSALAAIQQLEELQF